MYIDWFRSTISPFLVPRFDICPTPLQAPWKILVLLWIVSLHLFWSQGVVFPLKIFYKASYKGSFLKTVFGALPWLILVSRIVEYLFGYPAVVKAIDIACSAKPTSGNVRFHAHCIMLFKGHTVWCVGYQGTRGWDFLPSVSVTPSRKVDHQNQIHAIASSNSLLG